MVDKDQITLQVGVGNHCGCILTFYMLSARRRMKMISTGGGLELMSSLNCTTYTDKDLIIDGVLSTLMTMLTSSKVALLPS